MAKKRQTRKTSANSRVRKAFGEGKPLGVKICAVLYYIWAILWIIFGLFLAIGSSTLVNYLLEQFPQLGGYSYGMIIAVGIITGLILIALGILELFVARGLWKLRPWARVIAILLSILAIVDAAYIMSIGFQAVQIVRLVVDCFIVGYLVFSKEARTVFK